MSGVDGLLTGPRGRRLLLSYALEAERRQCSEPDSDSFQYAVFLASYHLDPGQGTSRVMFGPGAEEARQTVLGPGEVAARLSTVSLPAVTASALRTALTHAVDEARYWQDPDGEDFLIATEPVHDELRRVAEHIVRSPHSQWWTTKIADTDQWVVSWSDDVPTVADRTPVEQLRVWRDDTLESEARAACERPANPAAGWSGEWWSTPPVRCSTRTLLGGAPAGVWFVEDGADWERAVTRRLSTPTGANVYEVDSAEAWAELCRQCPVEVTSQKRHDWYRTTGRAGRWVVPDWSQLTEKYAGVHLTVAGYLAAAGTAIDVDSETASVIAGWAPDETYWLAGTSISDDSSRTWLRDDSREQIDWIAGPQP